MRDARDYKNTVEFAAEKVHNAWMKQEKEHGRHAPIDCPNAPKDIVPDRNGKYCDNCHWDMYPYSELIEDHKEYDRVTVIAVLNAVNYFDDKTCSDCEHRDKDNCGGFGICESFVPKGLVEESS